MCMVAPLKNKNKNKLLNPEHFCVNLPKIFFFFLIIIIFFFSISRVHLLQLHQLQIHVSRVLQDPPGRQTYQVSTRIRTLFFFGSIGILWEAKIENNYLLHDLNVGSNIIS